MEKEKKPASSPYENMENIIYPGVDLDKLKFEVGQEMGIIPKAKYKKK